LLVESLTNAVLLFLGLPVRDKIERRDIFRFVSAVRTCIPQLGGDYAGVKHFAPMRFEVAIEERVEEAEREPSDFPLLDPEVIARNGPDLRPG
jgi:hypothetical protein